MNVWYLSFATDEGFRGAVILRGGDHIDDAMAEANRLGVNPGGQVAGWMLSSEAWARTPDQFRHKLLSESEIAALDAFMGGPGEATRLADVDGDTPEPHEWICEDHNPK